MTDFETFGMLSSPDDYWKNLRLGDMGEDDPDLDPAYIASQTQDETVCTVCGDPNPARTTDENGTLMCESCLDDAVFEPCCYASTMHFGQGDHEWGCPNY